MQSYDINIPVAIPPSQQIQAVNSLMLKTLAWEDVVKTDGLSSLAPALSVEGARNMWFLAGDYWQNWWCWAGTRVPDDAKDRALIQNEIWRTFTPRPLITEIVERHVGGLVGQEPAFEFVSARDAGADKIALDALEHIKSILREREERILKEAKALKLLPSTESPQPQSPQPVTLEQVAPENATTELSPNPDPAQSPEPVAPVAPQSVPSPEDQASAASVLADALDTLAIGDEITVLQSALGLPVDDFEVPDDLPDNWKVAIEKVKAIRLDIEEETALLGEVNAGLGAWWDERRGHELLQEFARQVTATGRATWRFFVPSGLLDDNGELKADTWQEALESIFMEVPRSGYATVATLPKTMKRASVYSYSESDAMGNTQSRIELTFLAKTGETIVRILEGQGVVDEVEHDCGGQLYLDEAVAPILVGNAVARNQNALNCVNTMLLHNSNLAGFRERNYLNAQRPQKEVLDPTAEGGKRLVDAPVAIGATAANFLNGLVYKDHHGNTQIATPSVVITDPVSPAPLVAALSQLEDNIYAAVSQRHVKMAGDAMASAVSRVQARYEFLAILKKYRPHIEGVLRSRLVGIVCLAFSLAKDKRIAQLKKLRPFVSCHLNTGPMAPDERRVILDEYEAGAVSLETTQTLLGIEDAAAELSRIAKEKNGSPSALKERAEITQILSAAGASMEAAAETAGFDAKTAQKLAKDESGAPSPPTQPKIGLAPKSLAPELGAGSAATQGNYGGAGDG